MKILPSLLHAQSLLLLSTSASIFTPKAPSLSISKQWQILGPFQIGTREAAWGADPLELYGGFNSLASNETASFPSSLAPNGSISWSTTTAGLPAPSDNTKKTADLGIIFPEIDWTFHQQVYGWAGLQWQAWARGNLSIPHRHITITLQASPILEFQVNGTHYWGGDFYSFNRAPLVLHLPPGEHVVELRVVRDVRAMGGVTDSPGVDVTLEVVEQKYEEVLVQHGAALVPDLVYFPGSGGNEGEGRLASAFVEVVLRSNAVDGDVWIGGVELEGEELGSQCNVSLLAPDVIKFVPGQTRPLNLNVSCSSPLPIDITDLSIRALFSTDNKSKRHSLAIQIPLPKAQSIFDPHIVTHLHPSGTISQSLLRPPSRSALRRCFTNYTGSTSTLPILLVLHGAGVEVSSPMTRASLDELPDLCAWTLWASGVTAWSSDDWHTFGMRDVLAAIEALPSWRLAHPLPASKHDRSDEVEQGEAWPLVDTKKWLVAGHSNGGQGTWATLLHYPDNVIAAAPVSGYSSIQNYVPFTFWRLAEAAKTAIVQAALESWRHESLLPNAKGIPILQQHGGADDNVPPHHSRLMHQLLPDAGWESEYNEVIGKSHWWEGVMTTPELGRFFEKQLGRYLDGGDEKQETRWEVVTANPAEMGSKHDVRILLIARPGQLGRVSVRCRTPEQTRHGIVQMSIGDQRHCKIRTSNVRAFELPVALGINAGLATLTVDGHDVTSNHNFNPTAEGKTTLLRSHRTGQWSTAPSSPDTTLPQRVRWGRQLGSLNAALRTQGQLQIVTYNASSPPAKGSGNAEELERLALQISRNMQTYFHLDSVIHTPNTYSSALAAPGNIVTLALGSSLQYPVAGYTHGISILPSGYGLSIRDTSGRTHNYTASHNQDLGAIFLRPPPPSTNAKSTDRVELVLWATTLSALERVARLVPMVTGTGQPDFVLLGQEAKWKGVEGALAMGWLDEFWEATGNSYFS